MVRDSHLSEVEASVVQGLHTMFSNLITHIVLPSC